METRTATGETAPSYSNLEQRSQGGRGQGEGGRRATREGLGYKRGRGGADSTDGGGTVSEALQGEPRGQGCENWLLRDGEEVSEHEAVAVRRNEDGGGTRRWLDAGELDEIERIGEPSP
ncbi:uncharacterized protein DS421_8g241670 [Arachis hypogaea]|nr:uncharacterized protein DS421_8g241670 [Arachis hypogaea]